MHSHDHSHGHSHSHAAHFGTGNILRWSLVVTTVFEQNRWAVVGTLDQLPALAQRAGEGPALLVIGEVVARSDAWRMAENHLAQELAA